MKPFYYKAIIGIFLLFCGKDVNTQSTKSQIYNSDSLNNIKKVELQTKKTRLPYANEKNVKAHFEKLLNVKNTRVFKKSVKELKFDMGQYMKKHFTLYDYQKKYFDRESTTKPLVLKSGEKVYGYYSSEHKKNWDKFWDQSLKLYERRNAESRIGHKPEITFTPKFPPPGDGGDSVEGACLGFGIHTEEIGGETVTCYCFCIIIFQFCICR